MELDQYVVGELRNGTLCGLNLYDCDPDDNGMTLASSGHRVTRRSRSWWSIEATRVPARPHVGRRQRSDAWVDVGYDNAPLVITEGGTNRVKEQNLGSYLQARGEITLGSPVTCAWRQHG